MPTMGDRRKAKVTRGSLLRVLQDDFESFSRSRKSIARYLIDHLSQAPVLSAQELARLTGTTSSTVVRFAQHLGFSGFPEMMKAAWDEHRMLSAPPGGKVEGQLYLPVDDDFSGRAVRMDVNILEQTMRRNRADHFLETVSLLESSDGIYLLGMFEAVPVIGYMRYYMTIMGLPVTAVTDNSEESVALLSDISERSALVAVGLRTGHQFIIRVIKTARERGALTLGISDNQLSEVAKLCERNLFCQIDSTSFAPSLVGAFSIGNAIISALYARNRRGFDAHISRLKSWPLSSDWL
ncbi:MAG: MurR/RpiR family transcriptional regulator [Thermoleophilia bacterium]|nr:MurR/RpiR family transcriptional regulator [Thermoleophilia bacterium]